MIEDHSPKNQSSQQSAAEKLEALKADVRIRSVADAAGAAILQANQTPPKRRGLFRTFFDQFLPDDKVEQRRDAPRQSEVIKITTDAQAKINAINNGMKRPQAPEQFPRPDVSSSTRGSAEGPEDIVRSNALRERLGGVPLREVTVEPPAREAFAPAPQLADPPTDRLPVQPQ